MPQDAALQAEKQPSRHPMQTPTFDVLVLDDDGFEQKRLERVCNASGLLVNTTCAGSLQEFSHCLDARRYDLVLVDYLLPDGNGLQAQAMVQDNAINGATAVVMISSEMRADVAVQSLRTGSLDCISKDALDADRLRNFLVMSGKIFAEASRTWIAELLERQRIEIAQDFARVLRREMELGQLVETIDKRILTYLESSGLAPTLEPWSPAMLVEVDKAFDFK